MPYPRRPDRLVTPSPLAQESQVRALGTAHRIDAPTIHERRLDRRPARRVPNRPQRVTRPHPPKAHCEPRKKGLSSLAAPPLPPLPGSLMNRRRRDCSLGTRMSGSQSNVLGTFTRKLYPSRQLITGTRGTERRVAHTLHTASTCTPLAHSAVAHRPRPSSLHYQYDGLSPVNDDSGPSSLPSSRFLCPASCHIS